MILKKFTSNENTKEAIEDSNKEIQEMKKDQYGVMQIAQSESSYFYTIQESKEFHFTLTILFEKEYVL